MRETDPDSCGDARELQLTDFKAFHELVVNLRPLTVLLGPNNSGKSSIIAPIRLLAQTATSAVPRVPLLIDRPLGDFGTYRDLVYGNHRARPMRIALSGTSKSPRLHGREPREPDQTNWKLDLEFKFRPRRRQLILREVELSDAKGHLLTLDNQARFRERLDGGFFPQRLEEAKQLARLRA